MLRDSLVKAFGISLFCLLGVVLLAPRCAAQATSAATITGTVTDASGAVVPDAAIDVLNQNTGIKTTTKSNAEGAFVVPQLPIAIYTVVVTKQGFNTYSQTGIELHPGTVATVNPTLQAGSVVSTVTVKASATTVQTSTPEVASAISAEEVYTLPLNGRNFMSLAALMPGIINLTPDTALGQGGFAGTNAMSVNGMGNAGSVFFLDGVFNMNGSTPNIMPNPDTIQEVRVLQNNYGVQYNLQGASTVIEETKSGTDQFHLTAFEYLSNTDFNARNFFSPSSYRWPSSPMPVRSRGLRRRPPCVRVPSIHQSRTLLPDSRFQMLAGFTRSRRPCSIQILSP